MSEYMAEFENVAECAVVELAAEVCSVKNHGLVMDTSFLPKAKSNDPTIFDELPSYSVTVMIPVSDYSKGAWLPCVILNTSGVEIEEVTLSNDVLPRVSLQSSRVEALEFPDNTQVGTFLSDFETRVSGFDKNQGLQNLGVKYLYEYSRRVHLGSNKPFYKGKHFNASLPINSKNKLGHFSFEFSDDNARAAVRYFGDASLDAQLAKKGLTTGRIISRLQRDFGIGEVKNSTSRWTKSELNKVYTAFTLLPERDREVLQGLILEKVVKISNEDGDIHTLAHFSSTLDTSAKDVLMRKIVVSNKAFEDDVATKDKAATFSVNRNNQVIPVSIQTMLHEVGHGIEKQKVLQRALQHAKAIKSKNTYLDAHNQRVRQYNQILAQRQSALDAWQQLLESSTRKLLSQAETMDAESAHTAYSRVFEQIKKLNSLVVQLVNAHRSDQAMIDKVRKALKATQQSSVIAAGKQIINFKHRAWQGRLTTDYNEQNAQLWQDFQQAGTAAIDKAEESYLNRQAQRNTIIARHNRLIEFNKELTVLFNNEDFEKVPRVPSEFSDLKLQNSLNGLFMASQKVELTQKEIRDSEAGLDTLSQKINKLASELEAVSSEKYGSNRLQNFVKFVKEQRLQPTDKSPLTDYSLRSWREQKHGEFFAEAYSLYLTNYQFLLRHKPELYYYFEAKAYGVDDLISASINNQSVTIREL